MLCALNRREPMLIFLEDCPETSLRGTKQTQRQSSKKIEHHILTNQPSTGKLRNWFCTGDWIMDKQKRFFFQLKNKIINTSVEDVP